MKILIDPGHNFSGKDTGATGYGLKEQNITYLIAEKLKPRLENMGFTVKMSRNALTDNCDNSSISASLKSRYTMANEWGADYFISIHCNAGGGTGCEVYSRLYGTETYNLAECIQKKIAVKLGLSDRGVKTAEYSVLVNTYMPAVLVETAFIDKEKDARLLGSECGQDSFAAAIAEGVANFLNIEYKEELDMSQYEELKTEIQNLTETVKILAAELNNIKNPMIYNYIDDNMPAWARPTIEKLVSKGVLHGGDDGLNLTEDLMRVLVICDRAGLYD